MVALPQVQPPGSGGYHNGCGKTCGAGLEKVYPTTAVRWGAMGWIGEFKYAPNTVFRCGAKVVIQTERGIELGQQVSLSCTGCNKHVSREQIKQYIENSGAEFFRLGSGRILREATEADTLEQQKLNADIRTDIDRCALLAAQLNLDMKVITCEHLLGGERVVFYFRSEQRVDFRDLVKELAREYQTRIEMRQVGARDEARLVADYEICGRECCCKNFLQKLRPVTMKMAKLQKSTLDPSKLSGRCGRLRCCLRYEHVGYEELDRKLPKVGTRLGTEFGAATVVDRQILTQLLLVRTDEGREVTIPIEEIRPLEEMATRAAAAREQAPERRVEPPARGGERRSSPRPVEPQSGPPESATGETGDTGQAGADERSRRRRRRRRGRGADGGGAPRPGGEAPRPADASGNAGPAGDEGQAGEDRPAGEGREGPGPGPARRRRRRGRRRGGPGRPPASPGEPPANS